MSPRSTRKLQPHALVLCLDEKTALQPRPRQATTLPAPPQSPMQVEHESERQGARNLLATFDTRTGKVWGKTYERKRQLELIAFGASLDPAMPAPLSPISVGLDTLKRHKGKQVQAWCAKQPRLSFPFPPVQGAWRHQVEP